MYMRLYSFLRRPMTDARRSTPIQQLFRPINVYVLMSSTALHYAGPFFRAPPDGHRVVADRPVEVAILDERGSLSGANQWKGLQTELDKVLDDIQIEGLYTRHE